MLIINTEMYLRHYKLELINPCICIILYVCAWDSSIKYVNKTLCMEDNWNVSASCADTAGRISRNSWLLTVSLTFIETFSDDLQETKIRWRQWFQSPTLQVGPPPLVLTRKNKKACSWSLTTKYQENKSFDFQEMVNIFFYEKKQGFILKMSTEELGMHRTIQL